MKSTHTHFLLVLPRRGECVCACARVRFCVCMCVEREREEERKSAKTDRAPAGLPALSCHLGVARLEGTLDSATRSLISKRLASLSRNSPALPAHLQLQTFLREEQVSPSSVPPGAPVSSLAGPCRVGTLVHPCASVLVSLCSCSRGCPHRTRSCSVTRRSSSEGAVRAPCCVLWFNSGFF